MWLMEVQARVRTPKRNPIAGVTNCAQRGIVHWWSTAQSPLSKAHHPLHKHIHVRKAADKPAVYTSTVPHSRPTSTSQPLLVPLAMSQTPTHVTLPRSLGFSSIHSIVWPVDENCTAPIRPQLVPYSTVPEDNAVEHCQRPREQHNYRRRTGDVFVIDEPQWWYHHTHIYITAHCSDHLQAIFSFLTRDFFSFDSLFTMSCLAGSITHARSTTADSMHFYPHSTQIRFSGRWRGVL